MSRAPAAGFPMMVSFPAAIRSCITFRVSSRCVRHTNDGKRIVIVTDHPQICFFGRAISDLNSAVSDTDIEARSSSRHRAEDERAHL